MQSARAVTLDCVFLELWPFEMENSRFCDMVVSAIMLLKNRSRYLHETSYTNINQH